MSKPPFVIRVVSVDTSTQVARYKPGDFATVVFRVKAEPMEWTLPVNVMRAHFDDANLIPIARHYLHLMLRDLASQTEQWEMTPEEWNRHKLPTPSDPKKDSGSDRA